MARILLVDDDVLLCDLVRKALSEAGHSVEISHDGLSAQQLIETQVFDLAIFDWTVPWRTGLELCRSYRQNGRLEPILMLTARKEIQDKEEGLDSGADDYLTKPFDIRELLARVRSLLRRPSNLHMDIARLGDVHVDLAGHVLIRGESKQKLKPREMQLLEFFMRHPGQLLTSQVLLSAVWGSDFDGSDVALRTALVRLRKALALVGHHDLIETVHGFGYRFKLPD